MPYEEYYKWSGKWIKESYRILKNNRTIYIAIGDELTAEINIILKMTGFHFRNWILWHYTFGQNQREKFNRTHMYILYFTKDKKQFSFKDFNMTSGVSFVFPDDMEKYLLRRYKKLSKKVK